MRRTSVARWDEKTSRWKINVQKDGIRKSFYSPEPGRRGQRECNAKADAWLDDNIERTEERIEKLFEEYLDTLRATTGTGNVHNVDSYWRVWIKPHIGHLRIGRVNNQHLQDILNAMYVKGLSRKSLLCLRATITGFYRYCKRCAAVQSIPDALTIPKGARTRKKKILQPDALAALFERDYVRLRQQYVFDKYVHAYRLQVLLGLRPGELIGLRWSDIDKGVLYMERSINLRGETTTGKNENAVRSIHLSRPALSVLQERYELFPPTSPTDRIFYDLAPNNYDKRWLKYCDTNQLRYVSPYRLRNTFVSVASQLSLGTLQQMVGHSENFDTHGVYGVEVDGEMQTAAEQLSVIFEGFTRSVVKSGVK